MEYKIYYLTSIYDYNVPMYIGVTKQKLEKRLNVHKCIKFKTVDICKRTNWIKSRNKKITIHLIQTCEKEEEAIKAEQFWINFWKKISDCNWFNISKVFSEQLKISSFDLVSSNSYKYSRF